jgi:DNA topoisomerase VI subunit A
MKKHAKLKIRQALIIVLLIFSLKSYGQLNTIEVLYANGHLNYENSNWQYASVYLFAIIQRNPEIFKTDLNFKKEVVGAFDYSMSQLRDELDELKKLKKLKLQADNNSGSGIGSSNQGLTVPPPTLRKPSSVIFLRK